MVYITISSGITLPVRDFRHCLRSAKTKMADASKPDDVARCLNSLTLLNMRNIASDDVLSELVNDYFVTRPITNDDDDSDLSETELTEEESDPEGSGPARPGPGGDSVTDTDSASVTTDDDDGAAFAGAIENLADEIMPRDNGDTTEAEPECQLTCKCKLYDGQPCHGRFSVDELANVRLQFLGMTHDDLDIAILAKLSCGMHLSSLTTSSRKGQQNVRKAQRTDFFYHGFRVCRDIFRYIHDIGQDKLTALMSHYKTAGVEARVHKNKRKRPVHALKYEDTRAVIDFIVNYAEVHVIILPGRTPGHWKTDVKLLPTNCTKKTVYTQYCCAVDAASTLVKQPLPSHHAMPEIIVPRGLDAKRQWYLYDEIQPFTSEHCQDTTTPLPAVAKPSKKTTALVSSDSDDDIPPPPPKTTRGRGRKATK